MKSDTRVSSVAISRRVQAGADGRQSEALGGDGPGGKWGALGSPGRNRAGLWRGAWVLLPL